MTKDDLEKAILDHKKIAECASKRYGNYNLTKMQVARNFPKNIID